MVSPKGIVENENQSTTSVVPPGPKSFLEALFKGQLGYVEFRLFSKSGGKPVQCFYTLAQVVAQWPEIEGRLLALNRQGYNVYFGAAPRTSKSGRAADVAQVTALWADLDTMDQEIFNKNLEPFEFFRLRPTVVVESGHGFQIWWLLREPTTPAAARSVMNEIARVIGGDNVADPPRVMRLPGTLNVKVPTRPVPCRIVTFHPDVEYNLSDFEPLQGCDDGIDPKGRHRSSADKPRVEEAGTEQAESRPSLQDELAHSIAPFWFEGRRHLLTLGLAGLMRIDGIALDRTQLTLKRIAHLAEDSEIEDRLAAVASTYKQPPDGIAGLGKIREALGSRTSEFLHAYGQAMRDASQRGELAKGETLEEVPWPDPIAPEGFYGLVGKFIKVINPHTEADPAAILTQFLVAFGNVVGRRAHFQVEADKHYLNLFVALVGQSSKGRKGTSFGHIRRLFQLIDSEWATRKIVDGLSSGEGFIWEIHDPIIKRSRGEDGTVEEQTIDPGVQDKRLLVMEPEFASMLQVMERQGNTLSSLVRKAWDNGDLRSLTKNARAQATGAHVSIVNHITRDELRRYLKRTEMGNGFANRILWVCAERSKVLPDGGSLQEKDLVGIAGQLKDAVEFARTVDCMKRDDVARGVWHAVYADLSEAKPGLLGAVISRAEAQVIRLACVYALLDKSAIIRSEHLLAALAVWDYVEASARYIFGSALGDPLADELYREIDRRPGGMTRTQINDYFCGHQGKQDIARALAFLKERRLVIGRINENTGGRPGEVWLSCRKSGQSGETQFDRQTLSAFSAFSANSVGYLAQAKAALASVKTAQGVDADTKVAQVVEKADSAEDLGPSVVRSQ